MKLIVVRPLLIDVYINGRDRKPPVLHWAARGNGKFRSIRLRCDRTKLRQLIKDSSLDDGDAMAPSGDHRGVAEEHC